jgi:hypothetical protein
MEASNCKCEDNVELMYADIKENLVLLRIVIKANEHPGRAYAHLNDLLDFALDIVQSLDYIPVSCNDYHQQRRVYRRNRISYPATPSPCNIKRGTNLPREGTYKMKSGRFYLPLTFFSPEVMLAKKLL